jgi:ribosome-binding protein aMBF1 (putative translation factor)
MRYKKQKEADDTVHPFVQWIWGEINARGLSHTDVAKDAGIHPSVLRRWRDGTRQPTLHAIESVINVLGAAVDIAIGEI